MRLRIVLVGLLWFSVATWADGSKRASDFSPVYEVTKNSGLWPPTKGKKFPNLLVKSSEGRSVKLLSLIDRATLVEFIGMSCGACQAWSGAHQIGAIGNVKPQSDLRSIDQYVSQYSKVSFASDQILLIQIVLFDLKDQSATLDDARLWRSHFDFKKGAKQIAISGGQALNSKESFNLVPGFALLDSTGTVLSLSAGHSPEDNLYTKLLPALGKLVKASN